MATPNVFCTHDRCYSALKREEIVAHASTWLNLENIILSECQRQKTNIWSHLYKVPARVKFTEKGSRMVVARSWGVGRWGATV